MTSYICVEVKKDDDKIAHESANNLPVGEVSAAPIGNSQTPLLPTPVQISTTNSANTAVNAGTATPGRGRPKGSFKNTSPTSKNSLQVPKQSKGNKSPKSSGGSSTSSVVGSSGSGAGGGVGVTGNTSTTSTVEKSGPQRPPGSSGGGSVSTTVTPKTATSVTVRICVLKFFISFLL